MNRSEAREIAVRLCFEISSRECDAGEVLEHFFEGDYYESLAPEDKLYESRPQENHRQYIERLVRGVGEHSAELDGYIDKYARGWAFGRISRTAVAVVKTAMYEILYMPEIPNGAAINEAVEIAKKYDEPETVSFVNGILGSFVREEIPK